MISSLWSGSMQLGRINVPIKAFAARNWHGAGVSLRLLHDGCYSFIRNSRHCPIHGPVSSEGIVKGFEYRPGKIVVFESGELSAIGAAPNPTIILSDFCPLQHIDPIYFSGHPYYLVPNGHDAQQAYRVLKQAMLEDRVCAVSQIVLQRREYFVVVSPVGKLMTLSRLHFANTIREAAMFPQEPVAGTIPASQVQAAKTLISARLVEHSQFGKHHDPYEDRLNELIKTKIANGQVIEVAQSQRAITNGRGSNIAAGQGQPLGRPMRAPTATGLTRAPRPHRRRKPA